MNSIIFPFAFFRASWLPLKDAPAFYHKFLFRTALFTPHAVFTASCLVSFYKPPVCISRRINFKPSLCFSLYVCVKSFVCRHWLLFCRLTFSTSWHLFLHIAVMLLAMRPRKLLNKSIVPLFIILIVSFSHIFRKLRYANLKIVINIRLFTASHSKEFHYPE